jgi:hypothetical protein
MNASFVGATIHNSWNFKEGIRGKVVYGKGKVVPVLN